MKHQIELPVQSIIPIQKTHFLTRLTLSQGSLGHSINFILQINYFLFA